jgi:DNA polymerase III gamma/tau subunit
MSFESIIGQPLAVELCRNWLKRQTTNPLLMYGPEGVGKKTLGLETAKALNCLQKFPSPLVGGGADGGSKLKSAPPPASSPTRGEDSHGSCGLCLSCRKIATGTHPDVRVIDLAWQAAERKEPLEKQQNLRIETIQTERRRLLQSAGEGAWKVSILDDAHRLTADAANVLLKILEEPPAYTAIFLITPFRDRLFATIVSRCQPVRFRYLDRPAHLSHEEIAAAQESERLWQALGHDSPSRVLHETGGRSKSMKPNRGEIEQEVQRLLAPAARALRAGDPGAVKPVRLIQSALDQLRQNVQPALVYDNLLLQLARAKR